MVFGGIISINTTKFGGLSSTLESISLFLAFIGLLIGIIGLAPSNE